MRWFIELKQITNECKCDYKIIKLIWILLWFYRYWSHSKITKAKHQDAGENHFVHFITSAWWRGWKQFQWEKNYKPHKGRYINFIYSNMNCPLLHTLIMLCSSNLLKIAFLACEKANAFHYTLPNVSSAYKIIFRLFKFLGTHIMIFSNF